MYYREIVAVPDNTYIYIVMYAEMGKQTSRDKGLRERKKDVYCRC